MTTTTCNWCIDYDNADEDAAGLCDNHEAEREGLSVAELHRMDREQYADQL